MRSGARVDELLDELREADGRVRDEPVSPDRHRP